MTYRMTRDQTLQYLANLRNEPPQRPSQLSSSTRNTKHYKDKELPPPPPPPPTMQRGLFRDKENIPGSLVNRCAGCGLKLEHNAIKASNSEHYHVKCFACVECGVQLFENTTSGKESRLFYARGSKLYCYNDYHQLFSPRCAGCQYPIINDEVLEAMDKTWHKHHFCCTGCTSPFSSDMTYIVQDSMPWCEGCYKLEYGITCWKCGYMIPKSEPVIDLFDRAWCTQCFSCQQCLKSFPDNNAILRNDGILVCLECEQRRLKEEALSAGFA